MIKGVHYFWLVDETGFLQSHQVTHRTRKQVLAFLMKGLGEFAALGRGAAVVEVSLDTNERIVRRVEVTYNERVGLELRRLIERHLARYTAHRSVLQPRRPPLLSAWKSSRRTGKGGKR